MLLLDLNIALNYIQMMIFKQYKINIDFKTIKYFNEKIKPIKHTFYIQHCRVLVPSGRTDQLTSIVTACITIDVLYEQDGKV